MRRHKTFVKVKLNLYVLEPSAQGEARDVAEDSKRRERVVQMEAAPFKAKAAPKIAHRRTAAPYHKVYSVELKLTG